VSLFLRGLYLQSSSRNCDNVKCRSVFL